MLSCFHGTVVLINCCYALCACYGRKCAGALPGVSPAGWTQLDSRGWHQYATLSYAAFIWLRLRRSGFASLIYSSRLAAALDAGGCHPLVHVERCLERKRKVLSKHAEISTKSQYTSYAHQIPSVCVCPYGNEQPHGLWALGSSLLSETVIKGHYP